MHKQQMWLDEMVVCVGDLIEMTRTCAWLGMSFQVSHVWETGTECEVYEGVWKSGRYWIMDLESVGRTSSKSILKGLRLELCDFRVVAVRMCRFHYHEAGPRLYDDEGDIKALVKRKDAIKKMPRLGFSRWLIQAEAFNPGYSDVTIRGPEVCTETWEPDSLWFSPRKGGSRPIRVGDKVAERYFPWSHYTVNAIFATGEPPILVIKDSDGSFSRRYPGELRHVFAELKDCAEVGALSGDILDLRENELTAIYSP